MNIGAVTTSSVSAAVWTVAARSLTATGGPADGQTLQALTQSVGLSLTAVATTNVVNFSGAHGTLFVVGVETSTALGAGNITAFIDFITDAHTMSVPVYSGAGLFDRTGTSIASGVVFGAFAAAGSGVGDCVNFTIPVGFNNALTIALRITASTLVSGACTVSVLWAHV